MKSTSWVALVALVLLGGYIVYSSFTTTIRCEVCIEFEGRTACRAVDGVAEGEALAAARTNACALLASGVTKSMACAATRALKSSCAPL